MLVSDLYDYCDSYIVAKVRISVTGTMILTSKKKIILRVMLYLDHAYHKSTIHSQAMQKILILSFLY